MPQRWRKLGIAAAAGAATAVGLGGLAIGPLAPALVEGLADGRRVWRLGTLDVEGVSGSLGGLRIAEARLSDADGVWLQARDLAVDWRPAALFSGEAFIERAAAAELSILRRPTLTAPRPPQDGLDLRLDALSIGRIALAPGVAGDAATFALEGSLSLQNDAVERLAIDLRRTDGAEDRLTARYEAAPLTVSAELVGAAGGPFAALLGGPTRLTAEGIGPDVAVRGRIGEAEAVAARLRWTQTAWTLEGFADLGAIAPLRALSGRIGARVSVSAAGGRPRGDTAPFTLQATAPNARLDAQGRLGEGLRLSGPVRLEAEAAAEAASLSGGRLAFSGVYRPGATARLEGTLSARGVGLADVRVTGRGPALVEIDRRRVRFEARLAETQTAAQSAIVRRLLAGGALEAAGVWPRDGGAATLTRLELTGSRLSISARGPLRGEARLAGRWAIADLAALDSNLSGRAGGTLSLTRERAAPWRLAIEGQATRVAGLPSPLGDLIGPSARLAGVLAFPGGPVRLERASLQSRQLRLGARGRLGDQIALDWEASARGPARIGGVEISGAADVVGRLTGRMGNPALSAQAQLDALSVAGLAASRATLSLTLGAAEAGVRRGEVRFSGLVAGKAAEGRARLAVDDGLAFEDAALRWASFTARGSAAFAADGPRVAASLSGAVEDLIPGGTGAIAGVVRLAPGAEGAILDLELNAAQARLPTGLRITRAQALARGPVDALAVRVSAAGAVRDGRAFTAQAEGRSRREGRDIHFGGDVSGRLGEVSIASRAPVSAAFAADEIRVDADLAIGDGRAEIAWRSGARTVDGRIVLADVPIAPFAALAGERAQGSLSGSASLTGSGARLEGQAALAAAGLRVQERGGDPIDARLTGRIAGNRFEGALLARSAAGLEAALEGSIPLDTRAAPLRIARSPTGTAQAAWQVRGPIEGLWAVLGPLNQRLSGRVEGAGSAQLTGEQISGEGRIALTDGAFEDGLTGARLTRIDAAIRFDPSGATLERLTAEDGQSGRLTGRGRLEGQDQGRLTLTLAGLRLLNREDVRARGSGDIALAWRPDGALLSGELTLLEATAAPPQTQAAVPTLDVIEVNRPESAPPPEPPARAAGPPVRLDLRLRAPGRIYTRARGLNAEWSLDVRVGGTVDAPLLFGAARLLRGSFDLAGRSFTLTEGLVRFDGPPEGAVLRLEAERDTPDLTVRVLVEGTAADPELTLTSTPSLPEDEILPQALFGREAEELSGFEAAQLAGSLAALAGRSAFDIAAAARDVANLDRLEVREEDGGLLIAGGRYLTRGVYLEVARGPLGGATTSVEWQVRPRFFVISSFGAEGEQRVAVRWRREY